MSALPNDQVILVDSQDREIGVMDKVEAHRGEGKLHRAASVFLFNDKNQLLLQKRSPHKIVGANQWANTCCGNVRPGESYEMCAQRRLAEELGITDVVIKPVLTFEYSVRCNAEFSEHEMDRVFVGQYQGEVMLNPEEVAEVTYKTLAELKVDCEQTSEKYAPWIAIFINIYELVEKLDLERR